LCWQLKRAPAFASGLEPYPEFIKRCFIFTSQGKTFLDKADRQNIPRFSDSDPYNNPPWVQMYVGEWQPIPKITKETWADYSRTQYATTLIGAVSRDKKYLAAIANDSAPLMCQAWHDCMHNNSAWLPKNVPIEKRTWRLKIYAMENDEQALLSRVATDFPGTRKHPAMANIKIEKQAKQTGDELSLQLYQTQGIQDYLPVFYPQLKDRLTFPLSWLSGNRRSFNEWRKHARKTVLISWLAPPAEAPFEEIILDEQDRGSYIARKVVFNITADSRVMGLMLIPKGEGPFPAVLVLHDHGARFDIGKEKVIESWDITAKKRDSAQEWVNNHYGGKFIGDELAKRGYVCFSTDALNWSDRGGAGYKGQQALASNLFHMGMSLAGRIAHEDLRAAEFLAKQPFVDGKRIGAMGLSMGSYRTWQVAAMSDHISAGAAICWMATVKGLMTPGNNHTRGQSAYTMLHPGLFRYLDYPDVASLACPKPMLFFNGEKDLLFPVASVVDAYAKMRKVWESQNAGDRLVTKLWPVGHVFNLKMQKEAFKWLDTHLKK
jgi:dienelactone hydrolase